MMEKDEAVSTVIAMMLILGIIATLLAIYSATYLPGLKQQSEIEHSREVANAFVRFDSDIYYVISHKKPARFSEPFSLGGGDILLSPVRSSGLVTIEERPLVNVTVTNTTDETMTGNVSLANVSYVPSFTSWEPQGYLWEYGFVAVKKDNVTVPQSSRYNTMDEALEDRGAGFLRSLIKLVEVDPPDGNPEVIITVVNLTTSKEGRSFITGSGIATLGVNATASESYLKNVDKIVLENCTASYDNVSEMMGEILEGECNEVKGKVPNSRDYKYDQLSHTHTLTFNLPVTVTLRTVNVEVSVW